MTDNLIAFLRARLDEDEAAALPFRNDVGDVAEWRCDEVGGTVREVGDLPFGLHSAIAQSDIHATAVHIARHDPARVLREVDAKRDVLGMLRRYEASIRQESRNARPGDQIPDTLYAARDALRGVVRLLALPYADHPDYRDEWRP